MPFAFRQHFESVVGIWTHVGARIVVTMLWLWERLVAAAVDLRVFVAADDRAERATLEDDGAHGMGCSLSKSR